MACVNDGSRLSFSARSSGRYLSSFSISRNQISGAAGSKKKEAQEQKINPRVISFSKKEYSSYVITEWCVSAAQTALCMWLSDGCVAAAGCSVLTFRVLRGSLRPAAELLSAPLADWN